MGEGWGEGEKEVIQSVAHHPHPWVPAFAGMTRLLSNEINNQEKKNANHH